jgi:hypothetical protein
MLFLFVLIDDNVLPFLHLVIILLLTDLMSSLLQVAS